MLIFFLLFFFLYGEENPSQKKHNSISLLFCLFIEEMGGLEREKNSEQDKNPKEKKNNN